MTEFLYVVLILFGFLLFYSFVIKKVLAGKKIDPRIYSDKDIYSKILIYKIVFWFLYLVGGGSIIILLNHEYKIPFEYMVNGMIAYVFTITAFINTMEVKTITLIGKILIYAIFGLTSLFLLYEWIILLTKT